MFLGTRLEGALQFGPSLDRRKLLGLVEGTQWNGFLELNRLAFSDNLPRNSESRALGVALRLIRRQYPQIEWIVSFADATQCGDGTIYRAAGFLLTRIKRNTTLWGGPDGTVISNIGERTSMQQSRTRLRAQTEYHGGADMDALQSGGIQAPARFSTEIHLFHQSGRAVAVDCSGGSLRGDTQEWRSDGSRRKRSVVFRLKQRSSRPKRAVRHRPRRSSNKMF